MPRISIEIKNRPLGSAPAPVGDCGAVVDFRGVVRGEEDGKPISALEYHAYQPMAEREMNRIVRELTDEFACFDVYIAHRVGIVPAGEAAILVRVAARHRGPAFCFLPEFMDRLKIDVPIWKVRSIPAGVVSPT